MIDVNTGRSRAARASKTPSSRPTSRPPARSCASCACATSAASSSSTSSTWRSEEPRGGAGDAGGRARHGPHQDLRGRALAPRPGRDDAAEHHRRRARHPDTNLPDCHGKARILSEETMALSVERRLRVQVAQARRPRPASSRSTAASPSASAARRLKQLEKETGRRVFLEGSALPVDASASLAEGRPSTCRGSASRERGPGDRGRARVHADLQPAGRRGYVTGTWSSWRAAEHLGQASPGADHESDADRRDRGPRVGTRRAGGGGAA